MTQHMSRVPRAGRLRGLLVAVLASAMFVAAAHAGTWSQTYVSGGQEWGDGGIGLSAFNEGIGYNQLSWSYNAMRSTLCNASYQCYDYLTEWDGWIQDYAYITYGRAKCNSYGSYVYVYHCHTNNY